MFGWVINTLLLSAALLTFTKEISEEELQFLLRVYYLGTFLKKSFGYMN